jgi:hypothetical protein
LGRGEPARLVLPSHPFIEDELQVLGRYTAVEFSQVAFHDAPHILNVVGRPKVPVTVVTPFVGIAIEL